LKKVSKKRRAWRYVSLLLVVVVAAGIAYGGYLSWIVTSEFDQRGWDVPAQIFAAPLELYSGRRLSRDDFVVELQRLGYREQRSSIEIGSFLRRGESIELWTRAFEHVGESQEAQVIQIAFADDRIAGVTDIAGNAMPLAQLDPLLIGSIFPAHGEDRLILGPDEIPALLTDALKAVEDRRFDEHRGVDLRAILRASLVNLTNFEIRQGGSTLTQQLVRSYFLTNDRTWRRKLREAFMALALELRHDKNELMHAYVNEIYLGQDGARAIHGFGLASRFYFGKPLVELELHEIALLIAQVRGPSFYDPRRHLERALDRRNLVLRQMLELELISQVTFTAARGRDLDVLTSAGRHSSYYASFLDLVRRQLRRDYAQEDLQENGLRVFSTLDPSVQSAAETALVEELDQLQAGRPPLEGAVVVTNPHNAEVRALVGSRRTGYDGFNRALDAKRQVGSLIKPAVYLAALESKRHSLASLIDDESIDVPLADGTVWSPSNFNNEAHGTVTAVRALAESFNMATVRLGIDTGLDAVADLLARLGLDESPPAYPSLLLGALDLRPIEVTQIYNTLANGGFRVPLRAVRAVVDADGDTIERYGLAIDQVSDPNTVYALNQALIQVMERGTGRSARRQLPASLTTAGKTGTSDDLRDSWFAGFTSDHLVVTWIGNDQNQPIGLTGATGASRVWVRIVAGLQTSPYDPPVPTSTDTRWIDYNTGLVTDAVCPDAVLLAIMTPESPPKAVACGSDRVRIGSRLRRWLRNTPN